VDSTGDCGRREVRPAGLPTYLRKGSPAGDECRSGAMTVNDQVARKLEEAASLLKEQGASVFRVLAYKRAAETIRRLRESVAALADREGLEGLRRLPGIGDHLAKPFMSWCKPGACPCWSGCAAKWKRWLCCDPSRASAPYRQIAFIMTWVSTHSSNWKQRHTMDASPTSRAS